MNDSKNIINVVGKNSNFSVKHFDTLEEFQNYYTLHKDEIDKLSTMKLNRMFDIKGHKIARRTLDGADTKTLCFRELFKSEMEQPEHTDEHELENTIAELNDRIKVLELNNTKIQQQLLEIIKVINGA